MDILSRQQALDLLGRGVRLFVDTRRSTIASGSEVVLVELQTYRQLQADLELLGHPDQEQIMADHERVQAGDLDDFAPWSEIPQGEIISDL